MIDNSFDTNFNEYYDRHTTAGLNEQIVDMMVTNAANKPNGPCHHKFHHCTHRDTARGAHKPSPNMMDERSKTIAHKIYILSANFNG